MHAIGDQAVQDVLTWYDTARRNTTKLSSKATVSPRRHRIEHAQHLLGAEALAAFSQQQTVAVVNPLHLLSDMHIMEQRLGKERTGSDRAFAYHDMLKVQTTVPTATPSLVGHCLQSCQSCLCGLGMVWSPNRKVSFGRYLTSGQRGSVLGRK